MHARFLLGPAGSGKTFRCLAEIRAELLRDPAGPPLLLLAPKQATFQLERQLLADGSLPGYTRLQILAFDRLARMVQEQFEPAPSPALDDEGRVMVLRALLARERSRLKLFHATARLPGLATRLSALLRELQRHQISPQQLDALAGRITAPLHLRDKLHDFALLLRGYRDWLQAHQLHDADATLDAATALLEPPTASRQPRSAFQLAGLWLDGFAEMTAQELELLAAVIPRCERATLAFCLDTELREAPGWLSPWSVIGQTFIRCRQRLGELPGVRTEVELLKRTLTHSRFTTGAALATLEANWSQPPGASPAAADPILPPPSATLSLFSCPNPEAEAVLAAREIRRFVRGGGRFREAAVLVRSLDGYAETLRRVFDRYEIPYFLDRREPVAHHPLAELTRYALRTVAYGWRQADWFGALKTGLAAAREEEVDWLENSALEFGWDGNAWRQPLTIPEKPTESERAERLRQQLVTPFLTLAGQTQAPLSGQQLAAALREFWQALGVEATLADWSATLTEASALRTPHSALHATVRDQLHAWLTNLERAFPTEAYPVREWLPILEAGLATLTVGVIPPALDQVLLGAVDRSRNPELKLALVIGLNEGVFPAPPVEDPLLNELERDVLITHGARLGPGTRHRLGHEWFYGYIACTRARERLVLTGAQADAQGNPLNRSAFFDQLARIFPDLPVVAAPGTGGFDDVEHISEIIAPAIQLQQALGAPVSDPACLSVSPTPAAPIIPPDVPKLDPPPTRRSSRARVAPGQLELGLALATTAGTVTGAPPLPELLTLPALAAVLAKARQVAAAHTPRNLPPALIEELHGAELATSVSGLEDFAACPFKFFVSRSLRAEERKRFELDARERGSFQHDVLQTFHQELEAEKIKWRDVSPEQARARVRRLGSQLLTGYHHGLFAADETRRFAGELLLQSLETLITVLVTWAQAYRFDPALVEAGFGLRDSVWPAWRLDVGEGHTLALRGRIDRVDVWRDLASDTVLAVVMDYKSSSRKPDKLKLQHGLQLQLPAYLNVLKHLPEARASLHAPALTPAGVFYVNLRGEFGSTKSRAEALAEPARAVREGFQHFGRYDDAFLAQLDPLATGEQFKTGPRAGDRMGATAFWDLLQRAVANLQRLGGEIYAGKIAPEPYRKAGETACGFCDYASVCRFDPWTQPFRVLKAERTE